MSSLGTSTENRTEAKSYQAGRQENAESFTQHLLKQRYMCGGAETWTFREVHQKYMKFSEVWCWRRIEKISWTDRVKNEVLLGFKEKGNILHIIRGRNA